MKDKLKIPCIIESFQMTNYFQIVISLKKLQSKNSKYSVLPVKTCLTNILKPVRTEYDVDAILNSHVYQKLRERLVDHEKQIDKNFVKDLKKYMTSIRKQNDLIKSSIKMNNDMDHFENVFDKVPSEHLFNNTMLYDIYTFLCTTKLSYDYDQEIRYLGIEYMKYIDRFLEENSSNILAPLKSIEDKISVFVKMKYSQEEYKLEVYEGRYLFAEIYIYLRCGILNPLFKLMDQFTEFFENIEPEFKKNMSSWLVSKVYTGPIRTLSTHEDRFKRILYDVMQGKRNIEDHLVISSVEDYIWFQLINMKSVIDTKSLRKQFENYKSKKGLLLVYLMTKQYESAMDFIYNSEYPSYPTYHLMKELAKKSENKSLFVDLTFLLCTKMRSVTKKIECISELEQIIDSYASCVSKMIVRYKLYEVLGLTLDKKIDLLVVRQLKNMNDRKQLIKVYKLVEDSELITEILTDIFIEGILTNTNIDEYLKIFYEIKQSDESVNVAKLEVLQKFYEFLQTPDIYTLKKTSFFSVNFRLIEVKYVVEKVLKTCCEVIKRANDFEMAKNMFRVVGEIELSDDCIKYINKELILFI
jgi:hypothetical protein